MSTNPFENEQEVATETENEAVVKTAKSRTRKVSQKFELPTDDSTVAKIVYTIDGIEDAKVVSIDFADANIQKLLHIAAIKGFATNIAIAYNGSETGAEIAESIDATVAKFYEGNFYTRAASEKSVSVPDVVLAWLRAVGLEATDENKAKYLAGWKAKSRQDQTIHRNKKAIVEALQEILSERAAKASAKADDSDVEVL